MVLHYMCLTLKRILIRSGYKFIPKTGNLPKETKHALLYFETKLLTQYTSPLSHYLLNTEFRANSGWNG